MMESDRRPLGWWMATMALLIFVMIGIGGYTRLSDSGLSMTQWKPVTGWLPPLTTEQWQQSFELYRQTPEFLHHNPHFDLEDFKGIFWAEYVHRVFGRVLGLVFFVPYLFFLIRGQLNEGRWLKYLAIGVLGGLQGLMGWYMVKSGLVDRPDVSAYRLGAHLVLGGALFALCLGRCLRELGWEWSLSRSVMTLLAFLSLQILSGALVSGLEAGHALPAILGGNFPWMEDLGWLNLFENLVIVLTHHLTLAFLVTVLCLWTARQLWLDGRKVQSLHLYAFLGLQVGLGLITVVLYSPVRPLWWSLWHQLGAFMLLGVVVWSLFAKAERSAHLR